MSGRSLYAALLVLLCTVLCMSACAKSEPEAEQVAVMEIAPVEAAEQAHTTKYKDGVYTAGRKGYGGDIVVTATIVNDVITELKIEGENETKGVGSIAIERMRERILEAQFGPVDGVSGATVSSEAIKLAVSDILNKAAY